MKKFEYHVCKCKLPNGQGEPHLNELGEEGWELIYTFYDNRLSRYMVFKRDKKK